MTSSIEKLQEENTRLRAAGEADVTTQELVERLRHLEADAKDLRTAADRLLEADEMAGELKRLRAIMQNVADSCPHQSLHPDEREYDFGAHYFNTPDDYARYLADKNLSDIGDVLRAALEHQP
jgi:hypothetical protein